MRKLLIFDRLHWLLRWPVKTLVLVTVVFLVCFPRLGRFSTHVQRWRDANQLVEPDAPALAPLAAELEPQMTRENLTGPEALNTVQRFVLERIQYRWDWENWGNADYIPTVDEAIAAGFEDCDGRAVVAASLLKRFGYDARIVTDFAHVWVATDVGETMGPGKRQAVVAEDGRLRIDYAALIELPRALAYGLAVFPLGRELIILIVLWWLMLRRGIGGWTAVVGLAFLLDGLIMLRAGGANYRAPNWLLQWLGIANFLVAGFALLVWPRWRMRQGRKTLDSAAV